jgi:hypothetical protein
MDPFSRVPLMLAKGSLQSEADIYFLRYKAALAQLSSYGVRNFEVQERR